MDVDENDYIGLRLYANQLTRVGGSGSYINSREVTKRFKVAPGNYIIIPSTYDEGHDCEFMLRIFTELPVDTKFLFYFSNSIDLFSHLKTFFVLFKYEITGMVQR